VAATVAGPGQSGCGLV